MHRVELKEEKGKVKPPFKEVPNAPCGVESLWLDSEFHCPVKFLMHRVELKVFRGPKFKGR